MGSTIPRWAIIPPAFEGDDGALDELPLSEERDSRVEGPDTESPPPSGEEDWGYVTPSPDDWDHGQTSRPFASLVELTGLRHSSPQTPPPPEKEELDTIPAPTWLGDDSSGDEWPGDE